jgi:hypothetical protein
MKLCGVLSINERELKIDAAKELKCGCGDDFATANFLGVETSPSVLR